MTAAFGHGADSDFDFAGSSIKDYIEEWDPAFDRDQATVKAIGADWDAILMGHRRLKMSVKGAFDPTLDLAVWTAWTGASAVAFVAYPQGNTSGKIRYSGNCRVVSYKPGPAGGDKVGASFELVSDGTVTRA
jgi:hypothetical protein